MKINHFFLELANFKINLMLGLFLFMTPVLSAQEFWGNYLLKRDTGLFSIMVNLDLDYIKPNYKNLLIIGTKTDSCYSNGFPKVAGLEDFIKYSDATAMVLDSLTKHKLAGIITYKCTGFDVYYIKDTTDVRERMQKLVDKEFNNSYNFFFMERDKEWNYYYKNLFPAFLDDDFFADNDYLLDMVEAGDDLTQDRVVSHWFYFKSVKRREKFKETVENLDFKVDSLLFVKDKEYPYEIKISRKETMDPDSILELTRFLRVLSLSNKGTYDGWITETIVKD